MAFADDEKSIQSSKVTELYEFVAPPTVLGFGNTYFRYTSNPTDFDFDDTRWIAIPLLRASIQGNDAADPPEMTVEMPASTPLVRANAFRIQPSRIRCRILRYQADADEAEIFWQGNVTAITVDGRIAKLRIPSLTDDAMSAPVPSVYFQTLCNHALYDERCRVDRAPFTRVTTVTAAAGRVLTMASVQSMVDDYYKGGEVVRTVDGDRRLVITSTGLDLTLNYPFRNLSLGDQMTLYAGCNHDVKTCRDKFDNVINFGGHPAIGDRNPFISLLSNEGV